MSTDRDTTRIVRSWLYEGATALPDRVLDAVLDQVPVTRQRRAGWPARRWLPTNNAAKWALGAVAVIAVAFLGLSFVAPDSLRVGAGPAPAATAAPTPVPSQIPVDVDEALEPGRYALASGFPVQISFEVGAGWSSCSEGVLEQGLCLDNEAHGPPAVGIGFLIVENVVADPCTGVLLDPPVGASIDELAAAIADLDGFDAGAVASTTLDGHDAKRLTITAPSDAGCELRTWATPNRTNGVGPGETNVVYLVDVDGVRVMVNAGSLPSPRSDEALAEAEAVIASIQFEPRR